MFMHVVMQDRCSTSSAGVSLRLQPAVHLFPLEFITVNMSPSIRGGTLIDDSD